MKEDLNLGTFFLKMFLWTCRMQFRYNSVRKNLPEGQTVFAQCKKRWKELIFFSKEIFFLKMFFSTPGMQFWQPRQKKSNGKPIMFASCENILKCRYFAQKIFSIKAILGTRIRKFWQPRWKQFIKRPKTFR